MTDKRKDCPMRHENGNCTVAGGFCTAVNDSICEALHNAFDCGYRSAIRQQETVTNRNGLNAPLTLAELRTMDGEVWVCYPQAIFGSNLPPAEDMSCSRYKFIFSDYGKTWLAFRQKPDEVQK